MLVGLRTGCLTQRTESQQHLTTSEKESRSKKTRALQEGEHAGRRRWGHKTAVPGPCSRSPGPPSSHEARLRARSPETEGLGVSVEGWVAWAVGHAELKTKAFLPGIITKSDSLIGSLEGCLNFPSEEVRQVL